MTDNISQENVARMLEGVTPGPWDALFRSQGTIVIIKRDENGNPHKHIAEMLWGADEKGGPDGKFIAWAREAVPALSARLAEVEAQSLDDNVKWERTSIMLGAALDRAEAAEARVAKMTEAARNLVAANEGMSIDAYQKAYNELAALQGEAP